MVLLAVKMTLKMGACRCANEKEIVDDVVNVSRVVVDAAFDRNVGGSPMGGEHKLGEGE